jgi:hypothetical protein
MIAMAPIVIGVRLLTLTSLRSDCLLLRPLPIVSTSIKHENASGRYFLSYFSHWALSTKLFAAKLIAEPFKAILPQGMLTGTL